MTANSHVQTARIYVFPKGGSDRMSPLDRQVKATEAERAASAMLPTFGEAWYHEEAIRDAKRKQ